MEWNHLFVFVEWEWNEIKTNEGMESKRAAGLLHRKRTNQQIQSFHRAWAGEEKLSLFIWACRGALGPLGRRSLLPLRERLRQSINFSISFQTLIWFAFSLSSLTHSQTNLLLVWCWARFLCAEQWLPQQPLIHPNQSTQTNQLSSFSLLLFRFFNKSEKERWKDRLPWLLGLLVSSFAEHGCSSSP